MGISVFGTIALTIVAYLAAMLSADILRDVDSTGKRALIVSVTLAGCIALHEGGMVATWNDSRRDPESSLIECPDVSEHAW